jgi:ATPase subunit of ABC transporter with duplicated ATPase domains
LRTLVGERSPDAGELKVGNSIRVAYYDQQLGQVPLDKTLYDAIAELRPQWERRLVQGTPRPFGFSGTRCSDGRRRCRAVSVPG